MSFKAVQKKIEGQGHSAASAGAILASATRNASPAAKKANPKLNRVKGAPSADKPKAKKPPTKNQLAWAGIADQMLGQGGVPATGVGSPKGANGSR